MKRRHLLALVLAMLGSLRSDEIHAVNAPFILTPPTPATPHMNGPNVFGVRPDSPILFTIPATGEDSMTFPAKNLPRGLKLDAATGRITGKLKKPGQFMVALAARNALGTAGKKLHIVCGDQITVTPPMVWNIWNCFVLAVSGEMVKHAAEATVKSGLINHYINVDDYGFRFRKKLI